MLKVKVSRPTDEELKHLGIDRWSPWSCEVSEFDWEYDAEETCYFFDGHVIVKTPWEEVEIKKGDLVVFPSGLSCRWKVLEPVRKVYKFK